MKKLLIVVDYQNDFVSGTLGFEKAKQLESRIFEKIEFYKDNQDEVIFTLDTHEADYLSTIEGKKLPITHCIKNSEGWKLYGKIKALCDEKTKCFEKSTFGSDRLFQYLKQNQYESIELIGVVTNICVISNAVIAKTVHPEISVIVDASCVASNDDNLNEKALDVMESFHIEIINR